MSDDNLAPASAPAAISLSSAHLEPEERKTELLSITELIDHKMSIPASTTTLGAHQHFQKSPHTYSAVEENGVTLGLCSSEVIAYILAGCEPDDPSNFQPISTNLLPRPLFVPKTTNIRDTLKLAFARKGAEFFQHIIVVESESNRSLVGLIPVRSLVEIQSCLLKEQVEMLSRKEDLLRQTIQQQFRNTVELRRAQNRDNNYKQMLRQTVQQQFRTTMELRRSQARYSMLFENSGVGVALMNTEGQMTTCNRFLAELLSLPDNSLKDPISFNTFFSSANGNDFIETLKKLESQGEKAAPVHMELPVQMQTEKEKYFHLTLNFIPETSQHCVCVADVTEERRLQKHLMQKEKDVLLDSFVGGIAHELNNKVLPLLGYTELLLAESSGERSPEKIEHYSEIIKKSSSDCAAIVRQLLQLCKPTSGEISLCDLRTITKEALSFLLFRLREAQITVTEQYDTKEVPILADPSQIKQVVINLALNAIDAMVDSAKRDLTISVQAVNDNGLVEVTDTGCGIPTDALPRIFDPFFTTKKAETARGLGLSVSRSIARQSKGEILMQSSSLQGSCFALRLPLHHTVPVTTTATPITPLTQAAPLKETLRVLVVDDEDFVGGLVKEVLKRKLKAEVDRAMNGQEGTEFLGTKDYDLIISDVRMPVMNGAEFLRWTRENRPHLLPRFFFITGHEGSNSTSDDIYNSGVTVLRKPFTMDALVAQCNTMLGLNSPASKS